MTMQSRLHYHVDVDESGSALPAGQKEMETGVHWQVLEEEEGGDGGGGARR